MRTILTLFVASILLSTAAYGQGTGIQSIYIIPTNPSEGDSVYLVVEAVLPHSGCSVSSFSVEIDPNDGSITVMANYWIGMLTAECPTTDTLALGVFEAGSYELNFYGGYVDGDFVGTVGTASTSFVVGDPTGINSSEWMFTEVNLFPNPARELLNVSMRIDNPTELNFEIYDVSGKLIATPQSGFKAHGEHLVVVPVSQLPTGLYLLKISSAEHAFTTRFIRE
ncbi:MAG: T9SS C-terminal target domain-containing protein [Cryomorphaceae bacterium]|nr:MAG: T9SS C-terminal target domain-containing protein [Cryomorphaceae bacterium]